MHAINSRTSSSKYFLACSYLLGCDTTSAFYGKGKVTALKVAKLKENHVNTFENLGKHLVLPNDLKLACIVMFVICKGL